MKVCKALTIAAALAAGLIGAAGAGAQAAAADPEVFARAGGETILVRDYEAAVATSLKQKYYHGRPPAGEAERHRREVGEALVSQLLLAQEAERRKIEPDRDAVRSRLAEFERRYAASEQWKQSRESLLPRLTTEVERLSRLERLEARVRDVPEPREEEVRAYYEANRDRFTEPERLRLSLILLRLDPTATGAAIEAVQAKAAELHGRLKAGESFADLARAHSADPSAPNGGDLGYLHRGMLPEAIEKQFADGLRPGEIAPPARVLEGIAIVRLDERKAPRLRAYDEVAASARELLRRSRGDAAWARLKAELRAASSVWVDESRFAGAKTN